MQVNTTYQQLEEGLQSFVKSISLDKIKSFVESKVDIEVEVDLSISSPKDIGYFGFGNCLLNIREKGAYWNKDTVSCTMKIDENGKLVSSVDNGGKFKERTNEDLLNTMLTVYECKYT